MKTQQQLEWERRERLSEAERQAEDKAQHYLQQEKLAEKITRFIAPLTTKRI